MQNNPSRVGKSLLNGQRHESLLQVRKDGIKAFLDGKLLTELKTDFSNVQMLSDWRLKDTTVLGLGSWRSPVLFHKVELVEISGPGVFLRPDDPAAKKAIQKAELRLLINDLGLKLAFATCN